MTARAERSSSVDEGSTAVRAAIFVFATLVLLGLALLLLADVPDHGRSRGWQLTMLVMVWAALRLAGVCAVGQPVLFDFFFWLFVFLFLGLAPTVQIRLDDIAETTPGVNPALDLPTAGVVLLGVVAYEIGRFLTRPRRLREASLGAVEGRDETTGDTEKALGINPTRTLVLLVLAVALTGYWITRLGFGPLLSSRDLSDSIQTQIWPAPAVRAAFSALSIYPLLIATGSLIQLRQRGILDRWRGLSTLVISACILLLLVVANPISSARYSFGTVAFAILVFLGAVATTTRARVTMLGSLTGFLFLFPLADAFRRSDEAVSFSRTGFFAEYAGNPDYDGFWQIANALSYWLAGLAEPGRQFMGSILFWVPRSILADKPLDTGIVLARFRGYAVENLSAPLWAEGLVNGGLIGVVVALGLLGVVAGHIDRRLVPGLTHGGVWGLVGAVFPIYLVILLRGSLLQATGALIVAAGCVAFVSFRSTENSRPVNVDQRRRDRTHAHLT